MMPSANIQYIRHHAIDRSKWDACISNAGNELIYGKSGFLDNMIDEWDALVLNDYEIVMPLPVRKKWGIAYLFQPFLTPMLGVFGNNLTSDVIKDFLLAIPKKILLWDISMNHSNVIPAEFQQQYRRRNYILSLANKSYEDLRAGYSESIDRNITKSIRSGCTRKRNIPIEDVIDICKKEWPAFTRVSDDAFKNAKAVYTAFQDHSMTYGVYHPGGRLLAACLFLSDGERAYYWLVGNDPAAKELGASPFLIDHFIKDHAGKDLVLDFEGSDIEGVAEFYRRFGAQPEPYTTIYRNRLPFPLNLLKRTPHYYLDLSAL